jgi:hypothetical protein
MISGFKEVMGDVHIETEISEIPSSVSIKTCVSRITQYVLRNLDVSFCSVYYLYISFLVLIQVTSGRKFFE